MMAGYLTGALAAGLLALFLTVATACDITDTMVGDQNKVNLEFIPNRTPYKDCCEIVKAEDVTEPNAIKFKDANADKLYLLLMFDPDAPTPAFLHWILANIKGSDLKNGVKPATANTVLAYHPPSPPTQQHRYQFFLYEQKKQCDNLPKIESRAPWDSTKISNLLKELEVDSPAVANFQYSAYTSEKACTSTDKCKRCINP